MIAIRRFAATFALLLLAAGCASGPRLAARAPAPSAAGYPMDPQALVRDEDDDDEGRAPGTAVSIRYNLETEADELGPPRVAQLLRAQAQRKALVRSAPTAGQKAAGLQPSQWQALGPSNVGGRVRALAFDPRNPRRLLAGTASGGLWISSDGGTTWSANNDFMPNLSATAIAFDPLNASTVYLGTGEASQGLVGAGVFKSSDGGNTWQYLAATNPDANADWRFVNRIAANPQQTGVLLAGVTNTDMQHGAIYRSADAGSSWTRVASLRALDVKFDPNNPNNAVAGLDDGTIAYSTDAGNTWARSAPLVATPAGENNTARAEVAFAPTQAGLVYASLDDAGGEVWRSNDGGATWQKLSNPGHLGKQGAYDNAIWVDPTDANHVIVAGLDDYESRDGGVTFAQVSDWRNAPASPHADHHALASPPDFGPTHPALYDGNDGGVYMASNVYGLSGGMNGVGWTNQNNGLAVTQFYSGAGFTAAGGRIIGGTQDNGSLQLSNGLWRPFKGGDGGYVAVDPTGDQVFYGEYVFAAVHRALTGGIGTYICNGLTEGLPDAPPSIYCGPNATQKANFIAPLLLDPNNPNRLFVGGNSLWVDEDARGTPTWHAVKPPITPRVDDFINAIAVQPGNSNVVWVGHNSGTVMMSRDASSPSPSWDFVGSGVLPARRVMGITIDPNNANRVIVAFTGFVANDVWQTLDGGATWTSITGNLPEAPVFDVKIHPANGNWLYAATSVGVFASEDGGQTWSTTEQGPANIRVRQLFWIDDHTLGAATYGRGMYKVAVPAVGAANYQDLWWAGPQENGWGMSITQHAAMLFAELFVYDAQGQPMWVVMPGGQWNASFTQFTGALYIPSGPWFGNYDASRFNVGSPVGTATLTFTSASTASLAYTINGVAGTKSLARQAYGPVDPTPVAPYADIWWGDVAQNGWGLAINQQYRTLFLIWYTYDTNGKPVWYVASGGTWTSESTYTGAAYRVTSSPWLGTAYDASRFAPATVGSFTLQFADLDHATFTYTIDGLTQSKPIVRQPF